ncbi:wiskott-Aldrich syndrome protein homolog isoform X2 [Felis catus]|uniref:wiskott-Aldrich syndrome protein homolog isoform X2 n=1 Tax=Felis catus TaxID=9685 RepID=UPI001D1A09D7|nr:wiskott-Aldrich syndrome protein homolog isoform X2 [Felis catus]
MRPESALDSNPGSATWTVTCRKMESPVPNLQPSSVVTKGSGGQGRQMENGCGSFLHLSAHGLPQGPPSVHPLFSSLPSWLKCVGLLLGAPTASHGSQMDEQMTGWTQNSRGLTHGRCSANAAPPLAPWRRGGGGHGGPATATQVLEAAQMGSRSAPGCPGNQARSPVGRAGTGAGPSRPPAATRMLHAPHPPRLVPTPPPPPPLPPRPRPLPAHLQALLLALDRGGRTASQNAPPESGAQLAREPPEGCRYRLKTCPCTSSRQDGSFWTSVKGSPLQESVAGELPPFGVTGCRVHSAVPESSVDATCPSSLLTSLQAKE